MPKARYSRGARQARDARTHALSPSPAALAAALVTTPGRLSDADAAKAKMLAEVGVFPEDIGRLVGASETAVRRALQRQEAAQTLYDGAVGLAKDWLRAATVAADEGKHEPAMAALQAIEAVAAPEAKAGRAGSVTVNVGVALPGTPGAPLFAGEAKV